MAYKEDNTINHEITGTERFRLWGAKVKEMLEGVGLTRTADTGQINWATVEWPAAETVAGYEIYRFNDALQASRPIYMKIIYSRGGGEKRYRFDIQVGSKTNGAGTLEGGVSSAAGIEPAVSSGFAALGRIHICYSDSEFVVFMSVNPAQSGGAASNNSGGIVAVGRCRDVDGTIRSSASFADAFAHSLQLFSASSPQGSFSIRNGEAWAAFFAGLQVGQAALVNNVASPSLLLPYSATSGTRVVGPMISHLGFSAPSVGDIGKVEIYGKERSYIKVHTAQSAHILLRE